MKNNISKVRRIGSTKIKKISGGKEPTKIIEEFMLRRGFDPAACLQQRTNQLAQWLLPLNDQEDLEITLEGINRPVETTLYIGVNVMTVPLKDTAKFTYAALLVADTLIGAKVSIVNYDLVLSVTTYTSDFSIEDVEYYFEIITRQKNTVIDAITDEVYS